MKPLTKDTKDRPRTPRTTMTQSESVLTKPLKSLQNTQSLIASERIKTHTSKPHNQKTHWLTGSCSFESAKENFDFFYPFTKRGPPVWNGCVKAQNDQRSKAQRRTWRVSWNVWPKRLRWPKRRGQTGASFWPEVEGGVFFLFLIILWFSIVFYSNCLIYIICFWVVCSL